MRHWVKYVLLFCTLLSFPLRAELLVVLPASQNAQDVRFNDLRELAKLALDKTVPQYGPYTLMTHPKVMSESRWLAALKQGDSVNLVWSSTSPIKESELLPIRIPLKKGLLGYRIALINQQNQANLRQVHSLEDLKLKTIGQGKGWGDVEIYRANQIKVQESRYESLFNMLNAGRFDLFPRGISEVFDEYETHKSTHANLAIEQELLIVYHWPYYFFTSQQNPALAHRIETGLRMAINDGSFDQVFYKYHRAAIEQANLAKRRVIKIVNPLLPQATPLADKSLWLDPFNPITE